MLVSQHFTSQDKNEEHNENVDTNYTANDITTNNNPTINNDKDQSG